MSISIGTRFRSVTDDTEVVITKVGDEAADLRCGGRAMVSGEPAPSGGAPAAGFDTGTAIGKRYIDPETGLEVLCVKPGAGSLSVGERLLELKSSKALPSSD